MWAALLTVLTEVLPLILKWWFSKGEKRDEAKEIARDLQKKEAERALEILTGDTGALSRADVLRNRTLYWAFRERGLVSQEDPKPTA